MAGAGHRGRASASRRPQGTGAAGVCGSARHGDVEVPEPLAVRRREARCGCLPVMEGALETERLRLTPLSEADLDDLVDLDLEPEVRKFIDPQGIILPVDRGELRTYEWERHVSPGGFYGARERVGNAFVGSFQLEGAPDREGEVELGYRLRRHAWGLGYATEGGRALIAHAFDVLGYQRVYAHSLNDNPASIRVMEKVGLVPRGTVELPRHAGRRVRDRARRVRAQAATDGPGRRARAGAGRRAADNRACALRGRVPRSASARTAERVPRSAGAGRGRGARPRRVPRP